MLPWSLRSLVIPHSPRGLPFLKEKGTMASNRNIMRRSLLFICAGALLLAPRIFSAEKKEKETEKPGKWKVLFDGQSAKKWRAYKGTDFPSNSWQVVNGTLKTNPQGKPVDLVTKNTYDDFE